MSTFKYFYPELGEEKEDCREHETDRYVEDDIDLQGVAEEIAEKYFNQSSDAEMFPISNLAIQLFGEEDEVEKDLGIFVVEIEYYPSFSASKRR